MNPVKGGIPLIFNNLNTANLLINLSANNKSLIKFKPAIFIINIKDLDIRAYTTIKSTQIKL